MRDIPLEVINKASGGDMGAFRELYDAASGYVYNIAYRITANRESAEEVTQDVFLKVYNNLKGFRFHSNIKTWIYRIATNTALNAVRRVSRERRPIADVKPDKIENLPDGRSASDGILEKEDEARVKRLLGALEPDQMACVALKDIEGLSYREIAEALDININTVRSRLKRARERLLGMVRLERGVI
jgi:RNA polymerase sigma-70 factor (ECF subfamily)